MQSTILPRAIRGSHRSLRSRFLPTSFKAAIASTSFLREAKATLDVRLMSGQDPEAFLNEVRKVINDPAIRAEWMKRDVRPATPSARLDSEVFKVLESAFARLLRHRRAADDEHWRD